MSIEQNIQRVQDWAERVGIYEHSNVPAQALKAVSEMGELADAVIKCDIPAVEDAIGDVMVCLVNVAHLWGLDVAGSFERVTDEVTARKGRMVAGGAFVKDAP